MSITYTVNENTGVKYAYETTSEWNAKEQKTRTRRRYLGRVNPINGEIIPTSGVRGKKKKGDDPLSNLTDSYDFKLLYEEAVIERDALVSKLREAQKRITTLEKQLKQADVALKHCEKAIQKFRDINIPPSQAN